MRKFLLLKNIEVQNANALSSPYTVGFPAMTAWLGFMHALQRHVQKKEQCQTKFNSVGVICNKISMKVFPDKSENRLIMSKNPPSTRIDTKFIKKDGKPENKAFIPEATCNLNVSLLIEHDAVQKNEADALCESVKSILSTVRIAGGDILTVSAIKNNVVDENNEMELRRLTRQLMPGYFIKARRDLMFDAMQEGQDAIDALLSYLVINGTRDQNNDDKVSWEKKTAGWLVPIATGFHGITDLNKVEGQRDHETLHRFAEAVVTLGEFVMPYRAQSLDEMLWHYRVDLENNMYLCQQKQGRK